MVRGAPRGVGMSNKRKSEKPPEPKAAAPTPDAIEDSARVEDGRVVLERRFPPGAIIRPDVKPRVNVREIQAKPKTKCEACGSDDVERYASSADADYYRCRRCVDPNTFDWTTFKVVKVRTPAAKR